MTYQIRLNPGQSDEIVIGADEITSVDFAKTHSGFSDFQARIVARPSLKDEVFAEVYLEVDPSGDNDLLFRGTLLSVETDEGSATTTLAGKGVEYRLTNDETTVTYQTRLAHNAIEDFWTNQTAFNPTVTAPSPTASTSNQQTQEADTNAEFSDIVTLNDDEPLSVRNSNIESLQTSFTVEGEDWSDATNGAFDSQSYYSNGAAAVMGTADPQEYNYTFSTNYTITAEDFDVGIRWDSTTAGNPPDAVWLLDGEQISTFSPVGSTQGNMQWQTRIIDDTGTGEAPSSDIEPGTHTLTFQLQSTGDDSFYLDVVQPYDTGDRFGGFSYTYDNDNGGSGGYLDGPELFADSYTQPLAQATTSWNIQSGTLTTSWDDTSNKQRIQLRLSGQTWFPNDGSETNTSSVTTSFGSEVGSAIQGRATWSRYGSRTTATPQTGFNGQKLQSWEITFDGNNVPVISNQTFEGDKLQIAQDLHNFAQMRFSFAHQRNSLDVESFRAGEVSKSLPSDLAVINKVERFSVDNAANDVTIRGQTVGGSRLTHTVSDSASINEYGKQHFDRLDPTLKSQEAVKIAARQTLTEKLKEFNQKGNLEVQPVNVQPGPSYPNQFDSSGDDLPLEEIQYRVTTGSLTGTLVFDFRVPALSIGENFGTINRDSRDSQLGF